MNTIYRIKLILILLCATTMVVSAQTYGQDDFSAWDTDENEYIDSDEFNTVFDENEWYDDLDANRDGFLNEEEWDDGMVSNYPDYTPNEYGTFDDWDLNDNEALEEDEYVGYTFDMWDEDDDGYITQEEYSIVYENDEAE